MANHTLHAWDSTSHSIARRFGQCYAPLNDGKTEAARCNFKSNEKPYFFNVIQSKCKAFAWNPLHGTIDYPFFYLFP